GDRRRRNARHLARGFASQHLRVNRLPRRHQDQSPPGRRQNGMAAARPGRHGLSDELSARPPDRDALLHARNPEGLSPDLALPLRRFRGSRGTGHRLLWPVMPRQSAAARQTTKTDRLSHSPHAAWLLPCCSVLHPFEFFSPCEDFVAPVAHASTLVSTLGVFPYWLRLRRSL